MQAAFGYCIPLLGLLTCAQYGLDTVQLTHTAEGVGKVDQAYCLSIYVYNCIIATCTVYMI